MSAVAVGVRDFQFLCVLASVSPVVFAIELTAPCSSSGCNPLLLYCSHVDGVVYSGERRCSIILWLNLGLLMGLCPWTFTSVSQYFSMLGERRTLEGAGFG